jgi:hypothetical protein
VTSVMMFCAISVGCYIVGSAIDLVCLYRRQRRLERIVVGLHNRIARLERRW